MNGDIDQHLNLFNFFSDKDNPYYENNLTRALAITLKNDPMLLDRFLREIVGDQYSTFFRNERQKEEILIDLQKRVSDFQDIEYLIGVGLTAQELDNPEQITSKGPKEPVTDLIIQINETLIIFEVKRTEEDCRIQLIKQMEVIQKNCDLSEKDCNFRSLPWQKVLELLDQTLKFEKATGSENLFTREYYNFLEFKHPQWIGEKKLNEISFPQSLSNHGDPLLHHISRRLNVIKNKMTDHELIYDRKAIPVSDYNWINEVNVMPYESEGENYIGIRVWPGDTKGQGWHIFKKRKNFEWASKLNGYKLEVNPYIKFSHFNMGITWVFSKNDRCPDTHTHNFFFNYTGKWTRSEGVNQDWEKPGVNWGDIDKILTGVDKNWKTNAEWGKNFEDSGRNYFTVSVGYAISLLIPHKTAQELDKKSKDDNYPLVTELMNCTKILLEYLDNLFI